MQAVDVCDTSILEASKYLRDPPSSKFSLYSIVEFPVPVPEVSIDGFYLVPNYVVFLVPTCIVSHVCHLKELQTKTYKDVLKSPKATPKPKRRNVTAVYLERTVGVIGDISVTLGRSMGVVRTLNDCSLLA